jgi:hypothetical protein
LRFRAFDRKGRKERLQHFETSAYLRVLFVFKNLFWVLQVIFFAFFAAPLCELCGENLLTRKISKGTRIVPRMLRFAFLR